jgi:signal transduction histidine kinase/ActR/RegA family two-component response regulator
MEGGSAKGPDTPAVTPTVAIVIAFSHAVVRLGLRRLLEAEPDFRVVDEVSDGRQVLPAVKRSRPDVLVLDLAMPRPSGRAVVQALRRELPETRIVAVAASVNEVDVGSALRCGAAAYVLKGRDAADVVAAVRAASAGRQYVSPPLSDRAIASCMDAAGLEPLLACACTPEMLKTEQGDLLISWAGDLAYGIAALRASSATAAERAEAAAVAAGQRAGAHWIEPEFIGALSHEMRNPLGVILSSLDLVLEGCFGALSPEQAEHLQRAAKSAAETVDLFNVMLDLSSADAGRVAVDLGDIDLVALLQEIDRDVRHLLRPQVSFVWHVTPDLPRLLSDRLKLKMVLRNLVQNGLKFTASGSVMLDAHAREGGVEFAIIDTGAGIEAAALPAIFEPFQQAHGKGAPRPPGVGLGLYIAHRLTDLLRGTIAVESEPGRGSIFRVWLPARASPEQAD